MQHCSRAVNLGICLHTTTGSLQNDEELRRDHVCRRDSDSHECPDGTSQLLYYRPWGACHRWVRICLLWKQDKTQELWSALWLPWSLSSPRRYRHIAKSSTCHCENAHSPCWKVRVIEPLAVLSCAYLSYMLAELVGWSGGSSLKKSLSLFWLTLLCQVLNPSSSDTLPGIISLIGCGIVQAHYAFKNISDKSETTIKYFIAMLRFVQMLNFGWYFTIEPVPPWTASSFFTLGWLFLRPSPRV